MDDHPGTDGGRFLVFGVVNAGDIPGVFQYGVLKPPACSEKRHSCLAGKSNSPQCSGHAHIRTAGRTPQGIHLRQRIETLRRFER